MTHSKTTIENNKGGHRMTTKEKIKALAVRLRGRIFSRDVAKFLGGGALAAAVLTIVVLFAGS